MNKFLLSKTNNNSFIKEILLRFLDSKKIYRKLILIFLDYLSIHITFECLFYLIGYKNNLFFNYFTIIALPIYLLTKQFKPVTRFIGSSSFYQIIFRNFFIGTFASILCNLINSQLFFCKFYKIMY